MMGMGLWMESYPEDFSTGRPDTYLRDSWNHLDFLVVITGFASLIPGLPNVSVLRTFRVLRPLKSVAGLDGVKMVLVAVTNSIPELLSVIVLLMFVFAIFGILGLQFFIGKTHARCRLTPFPVTTDWVQGMDPFAHQCITGGRSMNFDTPGDQPQGKAWTKETSVWSSPKPCFWPLDPDDSMVCSLSSDDAGYHQCRHGDYYDKYLLVFAPERQETWCGSNWDALGNIRFQGTGKKGSLDIYGQDHASKGRSYSSESLTRSANYAEDFLWGMLDFDDFARAFLTIFQVITLEGWTDVMYMLMDAYDPVMTGIFFVVLVWFGSFFVLNLLLAVLENNYNEQEQQMTERKERAAAEEEAREMTRQLEALSGLSDEQIGAAIDAGAGWSADFPLGDFDFEAIMAEDDDRFGAGVVRNLDEWFGWCFLDPHSDEAQDRPPWRQNLYDLVLHPKFSNFITLCILLNTAALAADHHDMEPAFEENLEIFNFIFTCIFALEMFLKIPGLGLRLYMEDNFNRFDCAIVLISIIETIGAPPSFLNPDPTASTGGGGVSALRSFRLFRVFKLAREWEAMRQLLDLIVITAIQMGNFLLLFFIFVYIYALLGMQFFAGRMHFDPQGYPVDITEGQDRGPWLEAEVPRSNFDTLVWASATIFAILTGENWNAVMYDGMRVNFVVAILYFVTLVIFGNFIVMNIFMAILLANFDELAATAGESGSSDVDEASMFDDDEGGEEEEEEVAGVKGLAANDDGRDEDDRPPLQLYNGAKGGSRRDSGDHNAADHQAKKVSNHQRMHDDLRALAHGGPVGEITKALKSAQHALAGGDEWQAAHKHAVEAAVASGEDDKAAGGDVQPGEHPARAFCRRLVAQKWFDNVILMCILISSLTLAVDNPLNDPNTAMSQWLVIIDWIMTVIFTIEMVLKIAGLGLWGHPEAYLANGWNLLDGVIVVVGWFGLVANDSAFSAFKAMRALRALKPLRMINRYPGLQVVVGTMISSVGAIANVMIVVVLVFIIFAIMSVNYLKGKFYMCQGDAFEALAGTEYEDFLTTPVKWSKMAPDEQSWFLPGSPVPGVDFSPEASGGLGCQGDPTGPGGCCAADWGNIKPTSKEICECWGMEWDRTLYQRFDNTWVALGCLFEISTTEGWIDVMLAAVDSRSRMDMQPIRDNNEAWILFFVFFMIIGSFLMTNLFVGVIIQTFNELKEQRELEAQETGRDPSDLFLTEEQRGWAMTQKLLAQFIEFQCHRPVAPRGNALRAGCFHLISHPLFDQIIISCIILNTVVMAMAYFGMGDIYSFSLDVANFIFAMIFNMEAVLKIVALGKLYFYNELGTRVVLNNWNIFDFLVVLGTNIGIIVTPPFQEGASSGGGGGAATVIRMFRIGRLLRLINGAKDIKKMFDSLILTLPGLANVAAVVFLLFFIFAVIGVQLFATVAYHESLNEHANFRDFGMALITLMRFATGENWNGFMYEAAHAPYSGWKDTEASLESDAENDRAKKAGGSGSGFCDPDPRFTDQFVGGPWDGRMYGEVMCGFHVNPGSSIYATQMDGCVELNGCAQFIIFPYLKSFTLLLTFVFLNLFVGIILDGFSAAEESDKAGNITESEFLRIWTHWVEYYDTEETYMLDVHKVKSFLQTLHPPWGFGLEYVATDAELIYRFRDLNLTVATDGRIHFFKVLKGLSRRQVALTKPDALKEIDAIEREPSQFRHSALTPYRQGIPNFSVHLAQEMEESGDDPNVPPPVMDDLAKIIARMVIRRYMKRAIQRRRFKEMTAGLKRLGCSKSPSPGRLPDNPLSPGL